MSKLTTPTPAAVHQRRILANETVQIALAVAAVLCILLALFLTIRTGGPAHNDAGGGNTWVFN